MYSIQVRLSTAEKGEVWGETVFLEKCKSKSSMKDHPQQSLAYPMHRLVLLDGCMDKVLNRLQPSSKQLEQLVISNELQVTSLIHTYM